MIKVDKHLMGPFFQKPINGCFDLLSRNIIDLQGYLAGIAQMNSNACLFIERVGPVLEQCCLGFLPVLVKLVKAGEQDGDGPDLVDPG